VKYFFDNNLGKNIVEGMKAFGEDVEHLLDSFPKDAADTEWLQYIGDNGIYLISRDKKILHRPAELSALKEYDVGAFFLGGKDRNLWQLIQQLVRNWPRIKDYADSNRKPFAVRIPPTGTKYTNIPLT
jgi:hypothetical protein